LDLFRDAGEANIHRISHSIGEILNGIKVHPSTSNQPSIISSAKPKRVVSETKFPINYRQYLRHTDQGVNLYGKDKYQTTLEHSLGYYP
jgi:hypothetical protein